MNESSRAREHVSLVDALAFVRRWRWTIAAAIVATVALTAAATLRETPRFVATTTLLLQEESEGRGALAELAFGSGQPGAEGEIALLRSRTLLEEVVADPAPEGAGGPETLRRTRLGLASDVRALDLTTWGATVRRLLGRERAPHRLRAAFHDLPPGSEPALAVEFDAHGTLRVATLAGRLVHQGPYSAGGIVLALEDGGRVELAAEGAFAGQSYRVERRRAEAVVAGLRSRVRARETARGSGVIELTVEAADPALAADIANALAQNYIVTSIELGSRQATRTAEFVGHELARTSVELAAAEEDFVRLAREHARAIDIGAAAEALIERLADLEADRTHARLVRASLEEARAELARGATDALAALDAELLTGLSGEFIGAIGELQALLAQLQRSDVSGFRALLEARIESLRSAKDEIARRAAALEADLALLAQGDPRALDRLAAALPAGDPHAVELATLEAELARLVPSLTEKHFERATREDALRSLAARLRERAAALLANLVAEERLYALDLAAAEARLDEWPREEGARIDAALAALREQAAAALAAQVAGLSQRSDGLEREMRELESELARLPESERLLAEPLRRREALTRVVELLADSQQRAQLTQAATLPRAVVLDPARAPKSPAGPHLLINLAAALAAGAVLGTLLAYLRQAIGEGVYSAAELEHETGLAVLACVPRARGADNESSADLDGAAGEPYRALGDGLRFLGSGNERLSVVGFTSCLPSEGKTHTSLRSAKVMAGLGQRVLLVDADLRRPRVAERLGLAPSAGLSEVLAGEHAWWECLHRERSDGVDVLASGRAVRSPAMLLASARMRAFLEEARTHYDWVLVDLPPVLPVTDVEVVGAALDGLVLVYKTGGTSRRALRRGLERLTRAGAAVHGAVLNGVAERAAYADGFTYGYAYAARDEPAQRRAG